MIWKSRHRVGSLISVSLLAAFAFFLMWRVPLKPLALGAAASPFTPSGDVQRLYSALWRTDRGFSSTMRLQNALVLESIDVTPTIRFADGTEYDLLPMHLGPGEVASVSINRALAGLPPQLRRHASSHGTAVLGCDYPYPGAILGSIQVLDAAKGLSFNNPFHSLPEVEPSFQFVESLWWRQTRNTNAFISIANSTEGVRSVIAEVTDSHGSVIHSSELSLSAGESRILNLNFRSLRKSHRGEQGEAGGISISFFGRPGDILLAGGLEDLGRGLSAGLPFWYRQPSPAALDYSAVGLTVGDPPSESGFPQGTRFTPFLTLRNATEDTVSVPMTLNYVLEGEPSNVSVPLPPLEAKQTLAVEFQEILAQLGLSDHDGILNVKISSPRKPGEIVFALGSIDQTADYVLQVNPEGIGPSPGKAIPYWSTAEGNDTMVALWNHSAQHQDLVLLLGYNLPQGGTGAYEHRVSLAAGESTAVSLGHLIGSQLPDANGNLIPGDVREGRAVLRSAEGASEAFNISASVATLNVANRTCSYWCIICQGYLFMRMTPDVIDVLINRSDDFTAEARHVDGFWTDLTSVSTWKTADSSKVSVSSGTVSAIAYKSTPVSVTAEKSLFQYQSNWCGYNPICPPAVKFKATGSVRTREPLWAVLEGQSNDTGLCPAAVTAKKRWYGAYDGFGKIGFRMQWELVETVTSSTDCGVRTSSQGSYVTFIDKIFVCESGCTFKSDQKFRIQGKLVGAKDAENGPEKTGWRVVATTESVSVSIF